MKTISFKGKFKKWYQILGKDLPVFGLNQYSGESHIFFKTIYIFSKNICQFLLVGKKINGKGTREVVFFCFLIHCYRFLHA